MGNDPTAALAARLLSAADECAKDAPLLREAAEALAALLASGEPMFGAMVEADFEKDVVTFEMRGDYVCAAGLYEIRPHTAPTPGDPT